MMPQQRYHVPAVAAAAAAAPAFLRGHHNSERIFYYRQLGYQNPHNQNAQAFEAQQRAQQYRQATYEPNREPNREQQREPNSLFPHGEPFSSVRDTDFEVQRGLWQSPVWNHPEMPCVNVRAGGYTGIELIRARGEDISTCSFPGLTDFLSNMRPEPWQLVSPMWTPYPLTKSGKPAGKKRAKSESSSNSRRSGGGGKTEKSRQSKVSTELSSSMPPIN